jgi:dTDP-4-dehydrorhamnose reductase
MRILVTGATGQVGRALSKRLNPLGDVVPADRSVLNLAEPGTLAEALDRLSPDLIVNPAAYTAVDRAEDERELAFIVNGEAPGVIARWASRVQVPLVHFSTDYVFGGQGETPWHEDSPPAPLSAYGASKLAGEEAIRAANGPHLIVRTSWVYAATGTNFLRTITRFARERTELKVVADQIGAPTSARVIADAIAGILGVDSTDLPQRFARANGLVNIAASGETSWHGFAVRIVDGLGARGIKLAVQSIALLRTEEFSTRAKRPNNSRLDLTRLNQAFGLITPSWTASLEPELDKIAREIRVERDRVSADSLVAANRLCRE